MISQIDMGDQTAPAKKSKKVKGRSTISHLVVAEVILNAIGVTLDLQAFLATTPSEPAAPAHCKILFRILFRVHTSCPQTSRPTSQ